MILDNVMSRSRSVGTDGKNFLDIYRSIRILDFRVVKRFPSVLALELKPLDERRSRVEVIRWR